MERVEHVTAIDAPTVDLSVSPHETYFVGPGVLVHNTPPIRHYTWRDGTGASVPGGNFKIYLGTNSTDAEWADCIYVGQTEQSVPDRQRQHRAEAVTWLAAHTSVPDNDDTKRYYRFKRDVVLSTIADGLRNVDQADWLEQGNMDFEKVRRTNIRNFMNRREELKSTGPAVEARLRADPIVRASGYCP